MSVKPFTIAVCASAWEGVYRSADNPTITINGYSENKYAGGLVPIGATSWSVYNSKGVLVASGTCAATATQITVATSGTWASGGTVINDLYQFVVNQVAPSVSGGGVTTWNQASAPGGTGQDTEIWWGVVTTAGAGTVNVTGLGDNQAFTARVDEFGSGLTGPTWAQIAAAVQVNSASTTVPFPSLTATVSGQLYVGNVYAGSTISAGSTSGYVYTIDTNASSETCYTYNLDLSTGATSPTATQASSDASYAAGLILGATGTGSLSMSHMNVWTHDNTGSGTKAYQVSVSPSNVGDVLVLRHTQTAGNQAGGMITSPNPVGCSFFVGSTPHGFDPTGASYTLATATPAWCAWTGTFERNGYEFAAADNPTTDATAFAALLTTDPAFAGPGIDAARPRVLMISSSTQGGYQSPTAAQWGGLAAAMVAKGSSTTGATYEMPTNEPENGGWTQAQIISGVNSDAAAILAADSTAKILSYCSAGVYNNSSISEFSAVINGTAPSAASGHHENSYENQPDLVSLRQDLGGIYAAIQASSYPNLAFWDTETGNYGAYSYVYHPRRHARHCSLLAMVRELYGWPKEQYYLFQTEMGMNPADPSGLVESLGSGAGSFRAGGVALHVLSDALFGTTCTPTSKPAQLSFGSTGSPGDSNFLGLHYSSSALSRDVVLLASNFASDTVTLNVGTSTAASAATAQNGFGIPVTVSASGSTIVVPTDDLITAVFLPLSTTVSVVDTGSQMISVANAKTNLIASASLANESSGSVAPIGDGSFGYNWIEHWNGPSSGAPYLDGSMPASVIATAAVAAGSYRFVLKSVPPWNPAVSGNYGGATPIAFSILATIGGTDQTVFSYTNATAVTTAGAGGTPGTPDSALATTWWDHAFAFTGAFTVAGAATKLKLVVTQTSLSGEPDSTAAAISNTSSSFNSANQSLQLSDWQVYQGPSTPGPAGAWTPLSNMFLGGA